MGGQCGLSPRVRGKRFLAWAAMRVRGSIPACAGEARYCDNLRDALEVYPRVCGGSATGAPQSLRDMGLSPRVRGKPLRQHGRNDCARSIPACAGEASLVPPPDF